MLFKLSPIHPLLPILWKYKKSTHLINTFQRLEVTWLMCWTLTRTTSSSPSSTWSTPRWRLPSKDAKTTWLDFWSKEKDRVQDIVVVQDGTDYWLGGLDADRDKGLQWMSGLTIPPFGIIVFTKCSITRYHRWVKDFYNKVSHPHFLIIRYP